MMPVQPLRKEGDGNPRTAEEAKALVKYVESLFMPWNIDALVAGFTDDCLVRFGTVPEFRGLRNLTRLLRRAQQQAKGLSAQEELPHTYRRHHRQRLGRGMAGRRK